MCLSDVSGGYSPSVFSAMQTSIDASKALGFTKPAHYKTLDHHEALYMATLGGTRGNVDNVTIVVCWLSFTVIMFQFSAWMTRLEVLRYILYIDLIPKATPCSLWRYYINYTTYTCSNHSKDSIHIYYDSDGPSCTVLDSEVSAVQCIYTEVHHGDIIRLGLLKCPSYRKCPAVEGYALSRVPLYFQHRMKLGEVLYM